MQSAYKRNPGQERMRALFTSGVRYNLVYGGSRSGKTFEITGTVAERALLAPKSRHLMCRQEGTAAKRALVKGTWPEMIEARFPGVEYDWHEQYGYFIVGGEGAEVWVSGLNDEKALEKVLGNEYDTIYMNEASESTYKAFTLLETRLAKTTQMISGKPLSQRFYVDLNPTVKQHWTHRLWIDGINPEDNTPVDRSRYGHVVVNPNDNAANLSLEYLQTLRSLPERARKRFFEGQYSADDDNALWRREWINKHRVYPAAGRSLPEGVQMERIVVAIDPSATGGGDEAGVVAAGLGSDGRGYLLADGSERMRPEEWAARGISLYRSLGADRIVAEVNNGGEMVEAVIRAQDPTVSYRAVHATRGKVVRAEPVAALYELGKISHVGEFPALEDQLCAVTVGFDRTAAGWSPDRMDALVWALTDLFPDLSRGQSISGPLPVPKFSRV